MWPAAGGWRAGAGAGVLGAGGVFGACVCVCVFAQGGLHQIPWGARCSLGPSPSRSQVQVPSDTRLGPDVIKREKSTCNICDMQLDWVVRWVLSAPPPVPRATPLLGGAVVAC